MNVDIIATPSLSDHIAKVNEMRVFTPGPSSLSVHNLAELGPAFGRGDTNFNLKAEFVKDKILSLSGHGLIAMFQGSASLAFEIAANNFVYGKVLVVQSGYYSTRVEKILKYLIAPGQLHLASWRDIDEIQTNFDWVVACHVETSRALKLPMRSLRALADRCRSKLLIDATASIGLENDVHLADVATFSSCKGLCGLTGASFITFNDKPINHVESFYLNINTHMDKQVTGPYHIIQSLEPVLANYSDFLYAVSENKRYFSKKFQQHISLPAELQPLLCTYVPVKISCSVPSLMYSPRESISGSIVCHLGEVHLGRAAEGSLIDNLKLEENY